MTIRTRIAPSPTGEDIHIGNLYTALVNYTFAKKHSGSFIIRIEDTDQDRLVKGAEKKILSSVKAFGIVYDEAPDIGGPYAPYRQSDRLSIYKEYTDTLLAKGAAYYCFCTKERLDALRKSQQDAKQMPRYDKHCKGIQNSEARIKNGESYVIRLDVPLNKAIEFTDLIRGKIEFKSDQIDDQILIKSDGFPTYHLAVVVDDHLMKISHIVRAEEWISSTPKHIILYESFGWDLPIFCHLPILRNPDRSKLSKRKNPVWASWYLEQGFLPEAVINYLALLGWSHPDQKEIFTLKEFIENFDLKDIKPVAPIFDLAKLTWMNQQYIQAMDDRTLISKIEAFYKNQFDPAIVEQLLPLLKTRMSTLMDFSELTKHFFEEPKITLQGESDKEIVTFLLTEFAALDDWNEEALLSICKTVMSKYTIRMPVLYRLITGAERGLPLPQSIVILGKMKTIERLKILVHF